MNRHFRLWRHGRPALLSALLLSAASLASAQEAGGRGIWLRPEIGPADATGAFSGLSFSVTDKLSIESYFRSRAALQPGAMGSSARPPAHALVGQTVMGQYRFGEDDQSFRPRLGAGLAYSLSGPEGGLGPAGNLHNTSGEGGRFSAGRQITGMGLALEVGASLALSKSWYVEGSVMKSYIRSSGSALAPSTGSGAPGLKIDPLMFSFSVGFRFQ